MQSVSVRNKPKNVKNYYDNGFLVENFTNLIVSQSKIIGSNIF